MSKTKPFIFKALLLLSPAALVASPSTAPLPGQTYKTTSKLVCNPNGLLPEDRRTPEACAKAEFTQRGEPFMFPAINGVAHGLSITPGKPLVLNIWMDNQTSEDKTYFVGCYPNFDNLFEIRNASGLPMDYARAKDIEPLECSYNIGIKIFPHTWQYVETVDLSLNRNLPPGEYFIYARPVSQPLKNLRSLRISVPAYLPSHVECADNSTILPKEDRTPERCSESDFALYGKPVMFPMHGGLAYGISVSPMNPTLITIWLDNQTQSPYVYGFCCELTFARAFELHGENGGRVPRKEEIKKGELRNSNTQWVESCSCSGWVNIPSNALKVVDSGHLRNAYTLAPGLQACRAQFLVRSAP